MGRTVESPGAKGVDVEGTNKLTGGLKAMAKESQEGASGVKTWAAEGETIGAPGASGGAF